QWDEEKVREDGESKDGPPHRRLPSEILEPRLTTARRSSRLHVERNGDDVPQTQEQRGDAARSIQPCAIRVNRSCHRLLSAHSTRGADSPPCVRLLVAAGEAPLLLPLRGCAPVGAGACLRGTLAGGRGTASHRYNRRFARLGRSNDCPLATTWDVAR